MSPPPLGLLGEGPESRSLANLYQLPTTNISKMTRHAIEFDVRHRTVLRVLRAGMIPCVPVRARMVEAKRNTLVLVLGNSYGCTELSERRRNNYHFPLRLQTFLFWIAQCVWNEMKIYKLVCN